MTEQENVIKGLERCGKGDRIECAKCDYLCEDNCYKTLCDDAIALLKAQEPRVMTLEEAVAAEVMYYEPRYLHHGVTKGMDVFPVIRTVEPFSHTVQWFSPYFPEGKVHMLFTPDEYGILGRGWTSRPTEAQREATPWS